jgi:hypothetical protein
MSLMAAMMRSFNSCLHAYPVGCQSHAYPVGCQSDASVVTDEDGSPRLSDDASRVSAGFPG